MSQSQKPLLKLYSIFRASSRVANINRRASIDFHAAVERILELEPHRSVRLTIADGSCCNKSLQRHLERFCDVNNFVFKIAQLHFARRLNINREAKIYYIS